jgi:hypothetical protein
MHQAQQRPSGSASNYSISWLMQLPISIRFWGEKTMATTTEPDKPASGEVVYSQRAKRQDAADAMANDLVRGLVELITNSDDAYVRAKRRGPIQIEAEHGRAATGMYNRVIVRDLATGMTRQEVEAGILVAGARLSGHEVGHRTRGLQGRGAKDVAVFGKAQFRTIRDGVYTAVIVDGETFEYSELVSRPATHSDFADLGLPQGASGTEATIFVKRAAHSVPLHKNLADRLTRHFQLRDIMTDPKTEVTLVDLAKPLARERLTYQPPYFSEVVLDEQIAVPDYPATCRLVVRRSEKQFEDERNASRHGGILIAGRRAIYDSTYFGFDGRPGALWYSGRLDCDFIDDLQDEYDDHNDPNLPPAKRRQRTVDERLNGVPLVTRRRDGLEKNHPFAQRLRAIVEDRLRPLVEAEEKAASQKAGGANEDTKRRLRSAAAKLGSLYQELARQQELEVEETGGVAEHLNQPIALMITPDAASLNPDESKTFSIFAWPEVHESGAVPDPPTARIKVHLPEIATAENAGVALVPDKRQPRRLRGTVKVTAQDRLDATTIEISLGAYSAEAIIEVVEPIAPEPQEPPDRLTFRQDTYSMRVGRRRRLVLWAPNGVVGAAAATSPPGLHPTMRTNVSAMKLGEPSLFEQVHTDDGQSWQQAEIEVFASEACVAKVWAEFAGQLALTRVNVTDPDGQNPFDFDLTNRTPQYDSEGRAEWATVMGKRKLRICAGHPSLSRYFGPELEHQDEQSCRMLIAEVLADELAIDLLKREEKGRGGNQLFPDSHAFDVRRRDYASKFLKAAHEALIPDVEHE